MAAMFVNGSGQNQQYLQRTFYRCFLPISVHLAKRFQRRRFFKKLTNQKQYLPMVAMFVNRSERNEHSLQRTFQGCLLPSFDSFGQAVSEKIFKNRPIRNKNWLWWPCLLMDRDKMSNLQRGPFIDASYQVSLPLAEGFQRKRLKCENGQRTPRDGKSSPCQRQGKVS